MIERGRGCNKFVPVLRGDGTKIAPTGDIFDQPSGGMSWIQGKLADHVGDHVLLSPEEVVLVTFSGTESSYPRPPQSLNNSEHRDRGLPSYPCARLRIWSRQAFRQYPLGTALIFRQYPLGTVLILSPRGTTA